MAALAAVGLVVLSVSIGLPAVPVAAAPGELDPTFSGDGTLELDGEDPVAQEVGWLDETFIATFPDETKQVLNLRRVRDDGNLDPLFAGDGIAELSLGGTGSQVTIEGTIDGDVAVVATRAHPGGDSDLVIWRLSRTGQPMTDFGGDGRIELQTSGAAGAGLVGIGVRFDGSVTVAYGCCQPKVVTGLRLARFGATGELLEQVVDPDPTEYEGGMTADVDYAGRLVVVAAGGGDLRVSRYTYQGALQLDPTWSGDGVASIDTAAVGDVDTSWGAAVSTRWDRSGATLVSTTVGSTHAEECECEETRRSTVVARLDTRGDLDTSFSDDGVAEVPAVHGRPEVVAVEPSVQHGVVVVVQDEAQGEPVASIWQLRPDGGPELRFAGDGHVDRAGRFDGAGATERRHAYFRVVLARRSTDSHPPRVEAVALVPPPWPDPPGTPVVTASSSGLHVAWDPPGRIGDFPITGYTVRYVTPEGSSTQDTVAPPMALEPSRSAGRLLQLEVTAHSAGGSSAASPSSAWALPPFATVPGFVDRQFVDFVGRAPTASERTSLAGRVEAGTTVPGAAVAEVAGMAPWSLLDGITRLYYAYFLRIPDAAGLRYWHGRRVGGSSLYQVSKSFAASSEFKARYGALTNRGFVELVYQNVLDRAGDPGGIAYWTAELDSGRRTRGGVMVGFSESAEHKARKAGEVAVVSAFVGMMDRSPSAAEVDDLRVAAATAGVEPVAAHVLASTEYANHILPLP